MAPNKVFPLFMPFGQNNALKCENMDESILWHLRYGHLNFNGLKLLKQKNMADIFLKEKQFGGYE